MYSVERMLRNEAKEEASRRKKHNRSKRPGMRSHSLRMYEAKNESMTVDEQPSQIITPVAPHDNSILSNDKSHEMAFRPDKLAYAYRKIDAFKLAQRIREKRKDQPYSPLRKPIHLPSSSIADSQTPRSAKRQYSQEVISALMQYKLHSL